MKLVTFLGRRMAGLLVTLLVASFVIFSALYLAPGDPATLLLGNGQASPAVLALIRRQLHLDQPFLVRYLDWLTGALHGRFGNSFVYREPVSSLLAGRTVQTFELVLYAAIIIIILGTGLGVLAALRERRFGAIVTVFSGIAVGIPAFVAAIVLSILFALDWKVFPVYGNGSGVGGTIVHLTLPAFALALSWTAYVSQITRTAVLAELGSEHVETARARGLPERLVVRRHVLRNAMAPLTTVSGVAVAGLLGSTVVVEEAFGLNGLGSFLVNATTRKDFAVVQAIVLLFVLVFVVLNTGVNIVNVLLGPREAWSHR